MHLRPTGSPRDDGAGRGLVELLGVSETRTVPQVVLGVGGGIAAYKVCELLRRLTESGHQVRVVPTADALRFVGEPTWAALSGRPVSTGVWDEVHEVPHVRIGQSADLVFVAPATANILAKAAAGLADDLLTNTLLTARCPVVFAPAMHTEMWEHPATRANVATLRSRGAIVLEPAEGRLTGADTGRGRLPEPSELFEAARRVLRRGAADPDLGGRRVVISAGGTREAIDPVRYIGNHSSGKQGYALARTAAARGAEVTLVSANVSLPDPAGVRVVRVESARDLAGAMDAERVGADAVVMTSAVADFRPPAAPLRRSRSRGPRPPPSNWSRTPTSWPAWSPPGRRRAWPRPSSASRPRRTTSSPTGGPSWRARAVTCSWSTRSGAAAPSVPRTTRRSCSARTEPPWRSPSARRRTWPTGCGTWSCRACHPEGATPGRGEPQGRGLDSYRRVRQTSLGSP